MLNQVFPINNPLNIKFIFLIFLYSINFFIINSLKCQQLLQNENYFKIKAPINSVNHFI